jgi:hypothetical protein
LRPGSRRTAPEPARTHGWWTCPEDNRSMAPLSTRRPRRTADPIACYPGRP